MSSNKSVKEWHPARFTIGDDGLDQPTPFIVIISNQPLENKELLLKLCEKGD